MELQSNIEHLENLRIILILFFAVTCFLGYLVLGWMIAKDVQSALAPAALATIGEAVEPRALPEPIESPQDAPVVKQRIATHVEPATPPAPAKTIDKAEAMTAAGIAPSDQAIAAELLLDENGWIPSGHSYGVFLGNRASNDVEHFQIVHRYVIHQYGSWANTKAWATHNGGYW
jgi:hypothetical protein